LNVQQAAKALNVSPRTVLRRWHKGEISGKKTGRSHAVDVSINRIPVFSTKDLSEKMCCSSRWIQRLIKTGRIKGKIKGRRYVVEMEEAFEFMRRRSIVQNANTTI
jgi:excisionase family DNA binding protein